MPHTINLVSQFEDIIRRGGNELESNIASIVRGGWVRKSGSRMKMATHERFQYEQDESPPPIPKRLPAYLDAVTYTSIAQKAHRLRSNGMYLDIIPKTDVAKDKTEIFAIDADEQKTITRSSIIKTKRSTNSSFEYRDSKEINKEATERLTATPEDDIQSVHSYYKEEFKPTPSPRVSQPGSESVTTRLQVPVKPPKLGGFSYLHPSVPPSPPLSSVTSAISSPGHSPQGAALAYPNSSLDAKQNRFSSTKNYVAQHDQNNQQHNSNFSASHENLLRTGNNGANTPFISRAASYNSAVGHLGNEQEESSVRPPKISPQPNQGRATLNQSNIVHENLTTSQRDTRQGIKNQVKTPIKNLPPPRKYKMQRSPSSADISTYDGCGEASKKLQLIANFILLTASLVLIGTGAGLLGFYRLHMLEVITPEFIIVPMVLVVGGITTLFAALFGFYVTMKEDSCLMITYAVIMSIEFLLMVTGIVCTVDLLFIIQTGLFDSDVIPELTLYETDPWVRHKWDTMQREFTCCGGYGYATGYNDWKHTLLGGAHNSVPDSCCLNESPGCGANVFSVTDLRVTIQKIHLHGCLTIMMVRLETHVKVILSVFCGVGGIVAIIELLTIVLACCYANQIAKLEKEEEWEYDPVHGHDGYAGGGYSNQQHQQYSRPPSPGSTLRSCRPCDDKDVSSQHETAF